MDRDDSPKSQTASSRQAQREPERLHIKTQLYRGNYLLMAAAGILCMVFIWSNWFGFKDLWEIWQRSDEYSSGLLVPFLAAYVLWSRRERFACCVIKPTLWGLLLFVAAKFMKFFGLFFMYSSLERLSIVVSIAGLLLLLFGWSCFRKAFSTLLFLCLMLPLPASVHQSLLMPLQSWSTSSAVFCLEMMGYDVVRMGNIIDMNGTTVAVIEACNGLRMIIAFFVIGGFIALLSRRSRWERLVVFISCVPIALVCNTIRLTITAIAFTYVKGEYWEKLFHDFGGYAMMPLAIAIIVFEFWLLEKIVIAGTANQSVSNQRSGVELY
jgi:exosortase